MDLLSGRILGFFLVFTRVSSFMAVSPIFSWQAVPMSLKLSAMIFISVFFATIIPFSAAHSAPNTLETILLVANETVYGLALGLIAMSLYSAVKVSVAIAEREMGLSFAEIIDPFTEEREQPVGLIIEMVFILFLLWAGGLHIFLTIISKSYTAFPPGTMPSISILTNGLIESGTVMLTLALRLAAPILAAFMVLMVVLAILARIVPEMDILFMSFPLRIALGLSMTAFFLPFLKPFITEFADFLGRLLPM